MLSSDEAVFGGYENATKEANVTFTASNQGHDRRPASFQVRLQGLGCEGKGGRGGGGGGGEGEHLGGKRKEDSKVVEAARSVPCECEERHPHSPPQQSSSPLSPSQVYAPSRTVVVYGPADMTDKDADKTPLGIPGLSVKGRGPYFSV